MPVTSSTYSLGAVQFDGRVRATEKHVFTSGEEYVLRYLAPPSYDFDAAMLARVPEIEEAEAEREVQAQFDREQAVELFEVDKLEFLRRLRAYYKTLSRVDACRLAYWLTRRLAAGHITDAECISAYEITSTQWTNFKANKLTPQHDAWAAVLSATGG